MSRRVPKEGQAPALNSQGGRPASDQPPRESHIRELTPRHRVDIDEASLNEDNEKPARMGFFAQAARISMGDTFPVLKSMARFLMLDTYRSLPKIDRLPDLAEFDDRTTPTPGESEDVQLISDEEADQLLDWDELQLEAPQPSPYQRYLFDVRIEDYLRQTKEQMHKLLLVKG